MTDSPKAVRLSVYVIPRASQNALVSYEEGVLRLRLTALPVDGAANAACVGFVADLLGIAKSRVTLVAGQKRRHKVLSVEGMSLDEVSARLSNMAQ